MARYTRIFASIWTDPDFTNLTAQAQRLYLLLVTQPDVSHCGLLPLTERRWARLALDTDHNTVRAAVTELIHRQFIVVDETTEEVLVRSYIKWDDQWRNPNGWKAVQKARSQVISNTLTDLIDTTLKALTAGGTEAPPEPPPEGDASPQQPAASSHSHSQQPAAAAQAPPPRPGDNTEPAATEPAAAAAAFDQAIELAIEHRRRTTTGIRNPAAWAATVRPGLITEHGPRIRQLLAAGHTPYQAIATIYDHPRPTTPTDTGEAGARSMVHGLHLTGEPPDEIWHTVTSSHPRHAEAIADELQHLTGWTPPNATITPIRGATQ